MLEFLKPFKVKDYDCISFFQGKEPDSVEVEGLKYVDAGTLAEGSDIGKLYHIVLVRDHETDPEKFRDLDHFEAILACPLTYISGLIKGNWYGLVAKKTSTSQKFVDDAIAKLDSMC